MLEGYGFILPWVIGFLLFMAYPLIESLIYSFQDLRLSAGKLAATNVGWKHYRSGFTVDLEMVPILRKTVVSMAVQTPLILIFAMFCALLLNRPMKGKAVFRGIFFLPVIVASGEALTTLLKQGAATLPIFRQAGLKETLADFIPIQLLNPLLAMMDTLSLVMWGAGVPILILLGGLQTVSPSLYEAAKCDGATGWESFWKITFPMLMPMLFVSSLFVIVDSFTNVSNSMMGYIYDQIFIKLSFGYAAALGWIYSSMILVVIAIVFIMFRNTSALSQEGGR